MALYTGLGFIDTPVAGIIGLSTYAMNYKVKTQLMDTPVFLYHGKSDSVVTLDMAEQSYKAALSGVSYKFMTEDNLGHGLSPNTIFHLKEWAKSLKL